MNNIVNAPELEWLKANSVNGTPEGVDTIDKEYKRTWCSITLLNYVLEGNYEAFSKCQKAGRITLESFNELREYVKSALQTPEDEDAMRAFLVINDLGKVGDFVKKIQETIGFESVDHDMIMYEGLRMHPEFSPTFNRLTQKYKDLILEGLKTNFNMGQYIQSECLPANLLPLLGITDEAFNFYMIHVLFDIGGAAGHVVPDGTVIINELYWKKFSYALHTLSEYIKGNCDAYSAYGNFVNKTNSIYKVTAFPVMKLCNLMRVSNVVEAAEVQNAWNSLDDCIKGVISEELCSTGINDSAILMYYLPACLQNAWTFYKKVNAENALRKTISLVMPVIAELYKRVRHEVGDNEGVTVAFIADVATAAKEPENLKATNFDMKLVGSDFKFEKREVV